MKDYEREVSEPAELEEQDIAWNAGSGHDAVVTETDTDDDIPEDLPVITAALHSGEVAVGRTVEVREPNPCPTEPNKPEEQVSDLRRAIFAAHVPPAEEEGTESSWGQFRTHNIPEEWEANARRDGFESYAHSCAMAQEWVRSQYEAPVDTSPTQEERAMITRLHDGFVQVGGQLGIDLASRLPHLAHYHFFDDRSEYRDVIDAIRPGVSDMAGAAVTLSRGMFICRRNPLRDETTIGHETAHDLSLIQLGSEPRPGSDGHRPLNRPGYHAVTRAIGGPLLAAMEEFSIELFKNRMFHTIKSTNYLDTYSMTCMLGANILLKTAKFHGLPPVEVEDMVLRGGLTGDMTGLDLMAETLGEDHTLEFLRLPASITAERALAVADELHLPNARAAIETRRAKLRRPIFTWERPALGGRPFGV